MTNWTEGVEMRDGSLRFDPGHEPPASVPAGYARDVADPWRLRLVVEPAPCVVRITRHCIHGSARLYCERRAVYVNAAACCRCQGLIAAPGEVSL
jgi:hypothetical protein